MTGSWSKKTIQPKMVNENERLEQQHRFLLTATKESILKISDIKTSENERFPGAALCIYWLKKEPCAAGIVLRSQKISRLDRLVQGEQTRIWFAWNKPNNYLACLTS